ncbi:MAG: helix-turn-helix domain-containing protein [Ruminococcaceae bacterium]|nr:helix-turn-helix domain-containing protein [Oscillospiraceae bacterium]
MLYCTKRLLFSKQGVRKIENIDGFCLSYFDILILETPNGRINHINLGAAWNYFGTIIRGTGRFVSGETDITVREGETVFIPKGCVYRSEWHGEPSALFYSLPFVFSKQENNILFSLQKLDMPNLFQNISDIHASKQHGSLSAFSQFYSVYEKACAVLEKQKNPQSARSIYPAVKFIENHCAEDFDVPYLASLCRMSESGFYALFKSQMGTTPIGYKNRRRCIKAAELLRSTDYTVEYISEKLNFSSPMYLRKVLFSNFGKTPREIRKQKQELM